MQRIIGTIKTDQGRMDLVHDDQTGEFIGRFANGSTEPLSDWTRNTDPMAAREAAIAWYRTSATYDPWQLTLTGE